MTTLPYRYGGVLDVTWSLLNLSHGFAYDAARRIAFEQDAGPNDALELWGFSGGVQRFRVASRLLRDAGVHVQRLTGIAGPLHGPTCAVESKLLLSQPFWSDPVVWTTHLVDGLTFFSPDDVQRLGVRNAGGHHTPYFPHGTTRAPEAGYAKAIERELQSARR